MIVIRFDMDFNLLTPKGVIFFEKTAQKDVLVEKVWSIENQSQQLSLYHNNSGNVSPILMTREQNSPFEKGKIKITDLDCGLYEIMTPKGNIKITVSPQFSNIQMLTIYTHQIKSILNQIEGLPYNWIHLTPLCVSGHSKSAYSMASFTEFQLNSEEIQQVKRKKVQVDVVLNHLSPECALLANSSHSYNNLNRKDFKGAMLMDFHFQILNYYAYKNRMTTEEILDNVKQIINTIKVFEFELISGTSGHSDKQYELDFNKVCTQTGRRFGCQLNEQYLRESKVPKNEYDQIKAAYNRFVMERYEREYYEILRNLNDGVSYQQSISSKYLMTNYFCVIGEVEQKTNSCLKFYEELTKMKEASESYEEFIDKNAQFMQKVENDFYLIAACNGWVMGPAVHFTDVQYRVYQRRALVAWGDCIKLNYNPVLKEAAAQYVRTMAQMFDGLRIDNAHSTEPAVLEYCIQQGRAVNKNLLVMLECFTGSSEHDSRLCQNVGADLIVKEMIHCKDIQTLCEVQSKSLNNGINILGDYEDLRRKFLIRHAPAMVYEVSHDNKPIGSINSNHGDGNVLCLAVLGAATEGVGFATTWGSDLGFREKILTSDWTPCFQRSSEFCMSKIRQILLNLRQDLIPYTRTYSHNHGNFMTVERQNPHSFESMVFVIVPDFKDKPFDEQEITTQFEGQFNGLVLAAQKIKEKRTVYAKHKYFDCFTIDECLAEVNQFSQASFAVKIKAKAGTVVIIKKTVKELEDLEKSMMISIPLLTNQINDMNLIQLKKFLAQTIDEDKDYNVGFYSFGDVNPSFCGFDALKDCLFSTSNSQQVAQNIRQGDWFIDYLVNRHMVLGLHISNFDSLLNLIKQSVPRSYRPYALHRLFKIVDDVINKNLMTKFHFQNEYQCKLFRASMLLIGFKNDQCNVDASKWLSDTFKIQLSQQLVTQSDKEETESFCTSTVSYKNGKKIVQKLYWKAENELNTSTDRLLQISLSAGFPHFTSGVFRSWGRDVNLSITGILSSTFPVPARILLVSTASLLRHGLLPNLMDSGRKPRFNCRDAVWFWFAQIMQFVQKNGKDILDDSIHRIFLSDDENDYVFDQQKLQYFYTPQALEHIKPINKEQSITQVLREVLFKHLQGIDFIEWKCNDDNMQTEGHHVTAYVDQNTGLIHGGNKNNCHTWMDKMGSSEQFKNKGVPATPRCGAAVEINLCALFCLQEFNKYVIEPKLQEWQKKLQNSIQKFRIERNGAHYLRDTIESEELRPNYLIGLSFFQPEFVKQFKEEIRTASSFMVEPNSIGMKTLAPFEPNYNSWYNNNDNTSYKTANGFSYHNGPEWVHCMGRWLLCLRKAGLEDMYQQHLVPICRYLEQEFNVNGHMCSLPELTNANGQFCSDSCTSQLWSIASVLEAMSYQ